MTVAAKQPTEHQLAFLKARRDRLGALYVAAEGGDEAAKRALPEESDAYSSLYAQTHDRCRLCGGTLGDPPPEPDGTGVESWIVWDRMRCGYCASCAERIP
jgi:hypothetical protein